MTDLNVLSLFSGIGGLELGLERAGMTTVGQVEIDPFCQRVLAKHWPEVPRHDDVRTTIQWWGSRPRPPVDVICGGFPCQPVSVAGRRRAQGDDRWLWPAMADVIRALRPRLVVLENVPGLLARGLGDVLGDLAAGGYDTEWDCVPASALGAPHRRDRVWIVATDTCSEPGWPEPLTEPRSGDTAVSGNDGPAGLLADAEGQRRGAGWAGRPASEGQDRAGLKAEELADPDSQGLEGAGVRRATAERSAVAYTEGQRRGTSGPRDTGEGWANYLAGYAGQRQGEHTWAVEPDVGRVADGIPNRVDRLRALGNAVVPQVAEHIGRLIVDHHERSAS